MPSGENNNRRRDESVPWLPALIIVLVVIGALYYWLYGDEAIDIPQPVVTEEKDLPDDLKVPEEPAIKYPVPAQEPEEPVKEPVVEDPAEEEVVDAAPEQTAEEESEEVVPAPEPAPTLQESLSDLLGRKFEELFIPDSIVRHFVVTVDNMTTEKLPHRYSFTRPPPGKFAVIKQPDGSILLDPENYERYTTFIKLAENVDLQKLVDIYVRHYHRFQEAYENLGYPDRYFNDRLVGVIDQLLEAPEVSGEIMLEQPKVFYHFANPKLQGLSAGQKLMVRIGAENAARAKSRLRELRRLLTAQAGR